jgi:hypothetical protein
MKSNDGLVVHDTTSGVRLFGAWILAVGLSFCGSGGASPDATCNRYLECVSKAMPMGYPAALAAYGTNSSCWTNAQAITQCEQACAGSLAALVSDCGCAKDSECPSARPRCNAAHQCVECVASSDCHGLGVCNASSGRCVACVTNADCTPDAPLCASFNGASCVECDATHGCQGAGVCNDTNGVCGSPCDSVLYCTVTNTPASATWGACLGNDNCCAMEASCASFKALRACLITNCSQTKASYADAVDCAAQHCATEKQACHIGGC